MIGTLEQLDAPVAEQERHVARLARVEQPLRDAEQADGERDGDDERGGEVGALEPAEQALGGQPAERREQNDDEERRRCGVGTPWRSRSSK